MTNYVGFKSKLLRMVTLAALGLLLGGCVSMIAPQPPEAPTAPELRKKLSDMEVIKSGKPLAAGDEADPVDIAMAGYTLVENQCTVFFGAARRWANDTSFNRKEVTLAGAAAAGVLAALARSAKTIAITAIGVTLFAESLDNFQNFALYSPHSTAVSRVVRKAMELYRKNAPPEDEELMTDVHTAYGYVSAYADLCTYRRIQEFIDEAIKNAVPVDTSSGAASIFSKEEQLMLAGVNSAICLAPTMLSDEKYALLHWYFTSASTNQINRDKVLADFSSVKDCLWDSKTAALPDKAQTAARILGQIAASNAALTKAAKALEEENKPGDTNAAKRPLSSPSAISRSRQPPTIQLR